MLIDFCWCTHIGFSENAPSVIIEEILMVDLSWLN